MPIFHPSTGYFTKAVPKIAIHERKEQNNNKNIPSNEGTFFFGEDGVALKRTCNDENCQNLVKKTVLLCELFNIIHFSYTFARNIHYYPRFIVWKHKANTIHLVAMWLFRAIPMSMSFIVPRFEAV